ACPRLVLSRTFHFLLQTHYRWNAAKFHLIEQNRRGSSRKNCHWFYRWNWCDRFCSNVILLGVWVHLKCVQRMDGHLSCDGRCALRWRTVPACWRLPCGSDCEPAGSGECGTPVESGAQAACWPAAEVAQERRAPAV